MVADELKLAIVFNYFFFVQACLHAPGVVADKAKLAIVFTYFFLFLLVQACLCVPVVADEAKLAIVFNYFFLLLFFFLGAKALHKSLR